MGHRTRRETCISKDAILRTAPRAEVSGGLYTTCGNSRRNARLGAVSLGLIMAALLFLVGGPSAVAQEMLYEDRLPDGFAYMRFVNVTPTNLALTPIGFADPLALGTSGADRVSAYYVVEKVAKRTLTVKLGPVGQASFELKPGAFQTVFIERTGSAIGSRVVTDQMELSQTKARLSFYNDVPTCAASLYLEPKGQTVFKDVGPNLMRGRAVNPAENPRVRANCGIENVASLDLGPLDAGGQYSIWLIAPMGSPIAFLSKNKIAPFLR